jgi:Holliday junction DNA helicase RuvA
MFYYIKGTVALVEPGAVVIDAGGVGYALSTSLTSAGMVKTGESATFYTYLHVREDIFELYGFARQEELRCFKLLISVSGVGPKAALSILGVVTPDRFALCVITGDEKSLTAAPGVGKKLAQRIILELKDKLAGGAFLAGDSVSAGEAPPPGSAYEDAVAALGVLGYTRAVAMKALQGAEIAGMSTDEIVRFALKRLF